jgi:hypothetical protein
MSIEDNKFNEELDKAIDYAHKVTAEKGRNLSRSRRRLGCR